MKQWLLPSGLQNGIPFIIQDDWSPEQAMAVVELLDDLREVIWERYQIQIFELNREQRCTQFATDDDKTKKSDIPF